MSGIWRNNPETPEGKYPIVLRRDGSPLEVPFFVIVLRDPCASAALTAYADEAERRGLAPEYVQDVRLLSDQAESIALIDPGDPDAPRHREDDPVVIAWARSLKSGGRLAPGV